MNIDHVREHLTQFWVQAEESGQMSYQLPPDQLAQIDQVMGLISQIAGEVELDSNEVATFMAGGLAALNGIAVVLDQARTVLRAEPFTEAAVPTIVNVWLRAWAVEVSKAVGVEVR